MIEDIPTNIVTGFLGVGKTTAILNLLRNKPKDEYWAVLVNEFGKVAVDNTVIAGEAGQNVQVKEVAGGCVCCTGKVFFTAALVTLIRERQPDRLLIEPTGLGHLSEIKELIASDSFSRVLSLAATICLVDPRRLEEQRVLDSAVFQDQVSNAAIIVANKSDLATETQLDYFYQWTSALVPAPMYVADTSGGVLELGLLELGSESGGRREVSAKDSILSTFESGVVVEPIVNPTKGCPIRFENASLDHQGCGWIFDAEDCFDGEKVGDFLVTNCHLLRVKGVLYVDGKWRLYNCVNGESSVMPIGKQVESRIEVIGELVDADVLESELLECVR